MPCTEPSGPTIGTPRYPGSPRRALRPPLRSGRRRRTSAIALVARVCTMSPTSQAVEGARPDGLELPAPEPRARRPRRLRAAGSRRRRARAARWRSGGNVEHVVRVELAGQLDAGAREPLCEGPARRSLSYSSLRSSAPRAARATWPASSSCSSPKTVSPLKKTSTSPRPAPAAGRAESRAMSASAFPAAPPAPRRSGCRR